MTRFRYSLLGLRIDAITPSDIIALIADALQHNQRYVIAHHNLHSFYICHRESKMRRFYKRADYVHIDGMALVILGRLAGLPLERKHRATYIDLLPWVFSAAVQSRWKIFYLGSKPGVADRAAKKLKKQYTGLQMQTRHGYFNAEKASDENRAVLDEINSYAPDVLLVGMGMPRQEQWIAENWSHLSCPAVLCCGAALDYVSGEIPTPPRWMGQMGVEWLYRLLSEPKRLWRRYLVEPWYLLRVILRYYNGASRSGVSRSDYQ